MTATDTATEAVADVAEEVAEQALNVAEVSRGVSGRNVGIAMGAFLVGAGVGGGLVYVLAKRSLEAKYSQFADDEIEEMRQHYHAKTRALEAEAAKRPVEEIVRERGYSSPDARSDSPPMAVPPPDSVREDDEPEERKTRNVFRDIEPVDFVWDYQEEKKKRSPDFPYVIHYDETQELDYQSITLTWYEKDDVLCNERDEIIDPEDRNNVIGDKNLERFGHGSNDPVVVYIRNDRMELMYEVVKSPNAYAEEVHGFHHDAYDRGNLERMRSRERDAQEE